MDERGAVATLIRLSLKLKFKRGSEDGRRRSEVGVAAATRGPDSRKAETGGGLNLKLKSSTASATASPKLVVRSSHCGGRCAVWRAFVFRLPP